MENRIGHRLRDARGKRKISIAKLADTMRISSSAILKHQSGAFAPQPHRQREYERVLGLPDGALDLDESAWEQALNAIKPLSYREEVREAKAEQLKAPMQGTDVAITLRIPADTLARLVSRAEEQGQTVGEFLTNLAEQG